MSYSWALKAHKDIRKFRVYDSSMQAYYDPGNVVYAWVLSNVWPDALPWMSTEKKGDVVEALLGMFWFMNHPERYLQTQTFHWPLYVAQALDKVIRYVHDHWNTRDHLL